MNIWVKTACAAVSGIGCWLLFLDSIGSERSPVLDWLRQGLYGLLFAAGVLFPYLRRDRWIVFRASALVVVSSLSFMAALEVAELGTSRFSVPGVKEFVSASIVGAAIALFGARLLIPLRHSYQLIATGFPAAVGGGLVFAAPPLWGTKEDTFILAFAAWHVFLAVAIHVSERIERQAESFEPPSSNAG